MNYSQGQKEKGGKGGLTFLKRINKEDIMEN